MSNDHDAVRHLLGGYVLGGLDAADRGLIEDHLAGCADCRDEVAELAVLPGLLRQLTPDEAFGTRRAPAPPALLDAVTRTVQRQRRRRRQLTVIGGLVAAAVVAVALVLGIQAARTPPAEVATVITLDPSAGVGHGEARLVAKQWGTAVTLQAWQLPDGGPYSLEIAGADGHSECAAVWGLTRDGHAVVTGATSLQPDQIRSVQVMGAGQVVLKTR